MPDEVLRRAARRALHELDARRPEASDAPASGGDEVPVEVTRGVFDVTVGGRQEMVTVMVRQGRLVCTATDGVTDGPHIRAVMRLLAGAEGPPSPRTSAVPAVEESPGGERPSATRITVIEEGGGRTTLPAGATRVLDRDHPTSADRRALANALDDVVTAVVRLGVQEAPGSPSVHESVDRLAKAAPSPLPLGVSRWMGRLLCALSERDVDRVARVLDGAARVAADLRLDAPDTEALERIHSWLGATDDVDVDVAPIFERTLLEVAREWLPGAPGTSLERRYLVDLGNGTVYREERADTGPGGSLGPCPRVVSVGFAEVELGPDPRRIRLLQYAVSLDITEEDWSTVEGAAERRFAELAARYRAALEPFPGLAEPFAIIAPARTETQTGVVPLDQVGDPLPIARADDPASALALEAAAAKGPLTWIAGRLLDAGGRLMLLPLSAARAADGTTTHLRFR